MNHADSTSTQAIETLLSTYERSLNDANAELAASLYADDGVYTIDDIQADGDTAHALTRSEGNVTVLADGTRAPEANRELFVFQRRDDDWTIDLYIFNESSPHPAA